ncbi:MAG: hypothetical protein HYS06_03140 [Methylocystis sp.]|nr:hypothetical protein [Methylocystis sp.]
MSSRNAFIRFQRDRSGSYAVIAALALPAVIGFVGLAAEAGQWFYTQQAILGAADAGAISAATAGGSFATQQTEARGVAASYGYVDGQNGVTVTVNQPPKSGNYKTTQGAVEVIVAQPQSRLFSALFSSTPLSVSARAVAAAGVVGGGNGCVLALNKTKDKAIQNGSSSTVDLHSCNVYDNSSSGKALSLNGSAKLLAASVGVVGGIEGAGGIATTNGVTTGMKPPVADPYASVAPPSLSGCLKTGYKTSGTATLNPGVYCKGFELDNGAKVTLNSGVYYFDRDQFELKAGSTITGKPGGVTLVFTSSTGSDWAKAKVDKDASVNLTAPSSGATAGIVLFGDRNMPVGADFEFDGAGAPQSFGGAIYLPKAALKFGHAGATGGCLQVIADTIEFTSNSHFEINCSGYGTTAFGSGKAALVE